MAEVAGSSPAGSTAEVRFESGRPVTVQVKSTRSEESLGTSWLQHEVVHRSLERWQSGLSRSPAKAESGSSPARGFESRPFRLAHGAFPDPCCIKPAGQHGVM